MQNTTSGWPGWPKLPSGPVCDSISSGIGTDFICVLPAGHAGEHDRIDAMGMCAEHDDCRATRHQAIATPTNPYPIDWSAYRTTRENAMPHNHR